MGVNGCCCSLHDIASLGLWAPQTVPGCPRAEAITSHHPLVCSRHVLPIIGSASPSWFWSFKLEFLMVPVTLVRDKFFNKSFPRGSLAQNAFPQSLPQLFPTVPKLLSFITFASQLRCRFRSEASHSQPRQCWCPLVAGPQSTSLFPSRYFYFEIMFVCCFTCFSPIVLYISGRQEIVFVSVCSGRGIASAYTGAFVNERINF